MTLARRLRGCSLLAVAALLAACGSTVQLDQPTAAPGTGSLALPTDATSGAASPEAGTDDLGVPNASGDLGDAGTPLEGGDPAGPAPDAGGESDSADNPDAPTQDAFEESPRGGAIKIGIAYTSDGTEANSAIGAGFATGNDKDNNQALVDEINESGGVDGRKLEPVFFAYSAQTSETASSQDQAACSAFTEDESVAFVLGGGLTDTLNSCLLKAGVLHINSGTILNWDKAMLAKFPNHFVLGTMTQDRMMAGLVASLERGDWFGGWSARSGLPPTTKIGVLAVDYPQWRRPIASVLLPALKRAGHSVDSSNVIYVRPSTSTATVGSTAADVSSAVLRFASAGVTHVIDLDASALLTIFFAQTAASQGYYPRLGITSGTGAQAILDQGLANARTFRGAVGMGWLPNLDVPASQGATLLTPAADRCLRILRERTGQQYASANEAGIALSTCDSISVMVAGLDAAGDKLSYAGVKAGLESLGRNPQPALIPKSFLSPSHHDNALSGFDMTYDEGCGCIRYGAERNIP
ncbi:MAG: ABC transporter substrate-binding protein [Nocardioides sp.]